MARENANTEQEMFDVIDAQIAEIAAGRTQQQFILEGLTVAQLGRVRDFIRSFGGWQSGPVVEAVANA